MKTTKLLTVWIILSAGMAGGLYGESNKMPEEKSKTIMIFDSKVNALVQSERIELSDEEWKKRLPAESFEIMRQHGTERPFTCGILKDMGEGTYSCAGCDLDLFVSKHKFDSGTGWPSFFQPIHSNNIGTTTDYLLGKHYPRTEVHCARCGGHLGHVFEDGPRPSGLRYCINGASMKFTARK